MIHDRSDACAIVTITAGGARLGRRLVAAMGEGWHLYVPARLATTRDEFAWEGSLRRLVSDIFSRYHGLVFVMAAGIVVRLVAPHLRHKEIDPAVLVMDERGRHVISLLSGHAGGANALARQISAATGARAVITTASDVLNMPVLDLVIREWNLRPEPAGNVARVAAAMVNGRKVAFYAENTLPPEWPWPTVDMTAAEWARADARVLVTSRELAAPAGLALFLRPPDLTVGVGCKRGTPKSEILAAVTGALAAAGRARAGVKELASVDIKHDERGIREAAVELGVPVSFFSLESIRPLAEEVSFSPWVYKRIGVGAVCEPAALLAARPGRLILPKTVFGKVTVAIAQVEYGWWASAPGNRST